MKKINSITTNFFYSLLQHLVAPPFCTYCKRFLSKNSPLCLQCTALIRPIASATLPITKKYSMTIFAITRYTYPLKSLILAKRWSNIVASTQLGELMWDLTHIRNVPFDCIMPIPLHWTRLSWRGYNQAEEIAHILSTKSEKPILNGLCRIKRTPFQSSIPLIQRKPNLQHAFYVNKKYQPLLHNKHILLVDDLLTTGATLRSAARELIYYKPRHITAIVACRVI